MALPYYIVTTDDLVPASTTWTGTVSTNGTKVIGSSTVFLTEIQPGAWVWNVAQHQVRRVIRVLSDTELIIDSAFSAELSGADFKGVTKEDAKVMFMEIDNTGGVDTTIDNVAFASGKVYTDGQPNPGGNVRKFCRPVHVDGATSNCTVKLTMFGNTQV